MKRFLILAAILAAAIAVEPTITFAESRVDEVQQNQRNRIKHGVKDGSLTGKETGRLIRNQHKLEQKEHRFKRDGEITRGEKVRLGHSLKRESRRIYRQKHDGQTRR